MFDWVKRIWRWFRPLPIVAAEPEAAKPNRKERRRLSALERARRKHDVFVEPKGERPVPRPRLARERKPVKDPAPAVEVQDQEAIVETHHRDQEGPQVLYKENEFYGEYNFRDTVLEQLERYFVYLARMKKHDPDSYHLYRQVGAHIVPYMASVADAAAREHATTWDPGIMLKKDLKKALPPAFKKIRPSFGCFVFGADPETEKYEQRQTLAKQQHEHNKKTRIFVPKFLYFTKYKNPPPTFQPMSGGDVYKMTVWWDRAFDPTTKVNKHGGVPQDYGVFISADGKRIEVLRMVEYKQVDVLVKNKRRDARGNINFYHQIPQRLWRIPNDYEDWARMHGVDAKAFLVDLFCDCAMHFEYAQYSMIRVAAKKEDMTAVFSVNVRRMRYFFQDRDFILNKNGQRKPIFHMVRAHERHTVAGKAYYVPFHFRGEREFTWAGYEILITVPGRDHFMLPELDVSSIDPYWTTPKERKDMITQEELGEQLAGWVRQGRGGMT